MIPTFFFSVLLISAPPPLQVGFAEADISPKISPEKPVYIAGFGQNRRATAIHDPLMARAVVLDDGTKKIALVSIDVIGFFHQYADAVRQKLPGFAQVIVSSTHNHEGPDTLGLWGPGPFTTGVDPDYLKLIQDKILDAVARADAGKQPACAVIGSVRAPELLHDSRQPFVKHDELIALEFRHPESQKPLGVLVQWNCHPETLDSKNTQVSADYVGYTVDEVSKQRGCPVAYFTGTVGGLMSSLKVEIRNDQGELLRDGTYEKTERYGRKVGQAALAALKDAKPVTLTPFEARRRDVYLPVANKLYLVGWQIGVLQRDAYAWTGDPTKAELTPKPDLKKPIAVKTELNLLRLGELVIVTVPGEIYPELVLDEIPDPAPAGADFADAPKEPALFPALKGKHRMILGLANDEIGYIIPKRQWDEVPPFTYGLKKAPYGEINSLGPETAPLICAAFRELLR